MICTLICTLQIMICNLQIIPRSPLRMVVCPQVASKWIPKRFKGSWKIDALANLVPMRLPYDHWGRIVSISDPMWSRNANLKHGASPQSLQREVQKVVVWIQCGFLPRFPECILHSRYTLLLEFTFPLCSVYHLFQAVLLSMQLSSNCCIINMFFDHEARTLLWK